MKEVFRISNMFVKSFKTYCLLFISIILLFFCLLFTFFIQEEYTKKYQAYESHAQKVATLVDKEIEQIHEIYNNLLNVTWLQKMMAESNIFDKEFDYVRLKEINEELICWVGMNDLINHIGILFPYKNRVVSSKGTMDLSSYYYYFQKQYGVNLEQLKKSLYEEAFQWNNLQNWVVFRPLEKTAQPRSLLIIGIDQQKLNQHVGALLDDFVITFKMGKEQEDFFVIHGKGEGQRDKGYRINTPSKVMDLEYEFQYSLNKKEVFALVLGKLIVGMVLAVIGAVIIAYILALSHYLPVKGILEKAQKYNKNYSEKSFEYIEKTLDGLAEENSQMKERISQYHRLAINNIYIQLLQGFFQRSENSEELERYGMESKERQQHWVILIDRKEQGMDSDKQLKRLILLEKLLADYTEEYQLINYQEELVVILSSEEELEKKDRERIIRQIKETLLAHEISLPKMSYSQSYKGIIGISKAYQEALFRMSNIKFSKDTMQILFDHYDKNIYYYPTDWEVQLIKNLKQGNLSVVTRILDEIYQENIIRELSDTQKQRLTNIIMETLIRVLYELKLDVEIFRTTFIEIYNHQRINEIWEYIYYTSRMICENVQAESKEVLDLNQEILAYVKTNYMQPEMSLKLIGEEFNLSVASVSRVFKATAGVNFHEYITNLRMEYAKEMIKEHGYQVKLIAKAVGYESDYTFKRAFERNEGIKVKDYYLKIVDENPVVG